MLSQIEKQLNKHGLEGRKIIDEVFNEHFKNDYERMKRFNKNHGIDVRETFKKCNDPECCNYTSNVFYKILVFWKLFKKMIMNFSSSIPKNDEPHITWGH